MSKCLGLYIEKNIIKYAKVSKDKEKFKVDAFGVKFFEDIDKTIQSIIEETYSQRDAISINCNKEIYNYFDMFSLLSKADLKKAINMEFETYCMDKGFNSNAFEKRYAIIADKNQEDKLKVLHISNNKIELNKRMQLLDGYSLKNISPISVAITDLLGEIKEKNVIIVNIEEDTTVTKIIDDNIAYIEKIEEGSDEILSKINLRENSFSKSYEIFKNTTIYTSEGRELTDVDTTYLEDIMPTLYNIISKVMKIVSTSVEKIEKVYITGTGSLINNIDLYFQEYITEVSCEILKPYLVYNKGEINIKDYIEVNSAIALALMGLNEGIPGMNFKPSVLADKIPDWLKIDMGNGKTKKEQKNMGGLFTWDFNQSLDATEKNLLRILAGLIVFIFVYMGFTVILKSQMENKHLEAKKSIESTTSQIALANKDDENIKTKANEYTNMIKSLEEANDRITDRNKTRNAIPNLLNQLMAIIPERVQLTSIENTAGNHIVINAQSDRYEQLGYLKAKIKSEVILTNVISTAGQKDSKVVTVKIEGDLP